MHVNLMWDKILSWLFHINKYDNFWIPRFLQYIPGQKLIHFPKNIKINLHTTCRINVLELHYSIKCRWHVILSELIKTETVKWLFYPPTPKIPLVVDHACGVVTFNCGNSFQRNFEAVLSYLHVGSNTLSNILRCKITL